MRAVLLAAFVVALAVTTLSAGCSEHRARKLQATAGPVVVHDELSDLSFTLKPTPAGYDLVAADGMKLGTVTLTGGVVVRGPTGRALARVQEKPGGYELADGDGIPAIVGRLSDDGGHSRLVTPTGAEFAVAKGKRLEISGEVIRATAQGKHIAVGRGGRRVVKVEGTIEPRAAAFLGATELDIYQRIALLVWTDRWR